MVFVAGLIFAAALLLSTMISSAERPIQTNTPAAALVLPSQVAQPHRRAEMVTFSEMRVREIVEDRCLSIEEKIAELRGYESEARGLQRAGSESPMNASDGWEDDLRQVGLRSTSLVPSSR